LFVSFPNKYYGRIHKSRVTFLESEESYLNWKTEDIEIGQRLECRIISVDHEEKRYELSCLAEDNQENAIVRSVSDGVI
jgi:ribosomal protein S1